MADTREKVPWNTNLKFQESNFTNKNFSVKQNQIRVISTTDLYQKMPNRIERDFLVCWQPNWQHFLAALKQNMTSVDVALA